MRLYTDWGLLLEWFVNVFSMDGWDMYSWQHSEVNSLEANCTQKFLRSGYLMMQSHVATVRGHRYRYNTFVSDLYANEICRGIHLQACNLNVKSVVVVRLWCRFYFVFCSLIKHHCNQLLFPTNPKETSYLQLIEDRLQKLAGLASFCAAHINIWPLERAQHVPTIFRKTSELAQVQV